MDALNRLNVVRTSLHIKRETQLLVPDFFYQPSDPTLWTLFKSKLEEIMEFLEDNRAIRGDGDYAWKVICDETSNTSDIVNANGMLALIEWTPIKSVERIKVISTIRD